MAEPANPRFTSAPRTSDRDRERTVARLRSACASGEIGVDTFEVRLGMTLTARTLYELRTVTRDLQTVWDRIRRAVGATPRVLGKEAVQRLPALSIDPERSIIVIGRSRSSDLIIEQDSISRRHALLARREDGWRLTDLDSTNGTRVNGRPIDRPTLIAPGDHIAFGELLLEFRTRDTAPA